MYCPKCGTELPNDAFFCRNCGQALTGGNAKKNKETNPKLLWIIAAVFSLIVIAAAALLIGKSFQRELGNEQTTNARMFRFLCQKGNEQPYFYVPGYSETILTYRDGVIEPVFSSSRTIVSIFDAGDKLIVEIRDAADEYIFSSIDKKTGFEEDLLTFSDGQAAIILNVFQNKIYYAFAYDADATYSIADTQTYSYDIKTGETRYLLDGGCYISNKGIYYSVEGVEYGELWFIKFSNITRTSGKLIKRALNAEDDLMFLSPVFVDKGYVYYFTSYDGLADSGGVLFERSGKTDDTIGYGNNLNMINGKMFFIQDGALFSVNPNNLAQRDLIVSDVTPEESDDYFNDFALFKDPANPNEIVIATTDFLSGKIYFWNEAGELITIYELE